MHAGCVTEPHPRPHKGCAVPAAGEAAAHLHLHRRWTGPSHVPHMALARTQLPRPGSRWEAGHGPEASSGSRCAGLGLGLGLGRGGGAAPDPAEGRSPPVPSATTQHAAPAPCAWSVLCPVPSEQSVEGAPPCPPPAPRSAVSCRPPAMPHGPHWLWGPLAWRDHITMPRGMNPGSGLCGMWQGVRATPRPPAAPAPSQPPEPWGRPSGPPWS